MKFRTKVKSISKGHFMKLGKLLKHFWQANKTTLPVMFAFNLLAVWISFVHFNGEKAIDERAGLHNLLIFVNFIFALWSVWRMNLKMDDYIPLLHENPLDFKPTHLIWALGLIIFVALIPMYLFLPAICWLETLYTKAFFGKFFGTVICLTSFVQVFACGWAMNLNNRKMFLAHVGEAPEKIEGHFLLGLFRSFIDFYFYYMMLACFGLFLYKMYGDSMVASFPNFRILDVIFCITAAVLMCIKAIYELNSHRPFLWSSSSSWGMDLPAGVIKVLMVTIVAVTIPAPTEQEALKLAEMQKQEQIKNIPNYADVKAQMGECVDGKDKLGKACDMKRMPSSGQNQDMEITQPLRQGVDPEGVQ